MELKLGNHSLVVDELWDGYNQVRNFFWKRGVEQSKRFWDKYWECSGMDVASKVFGECINETLEDTVQCVSKILFDTGMTDINTNRLAENYQTNYIDLEFMLKPLVDKMLAIQEIQENMELQSTIKKMCRPQWQGGGFGIGGALVGAATSVALNAATSGLFAIGDFFKSNSNNSKINKLKTILYNDPETISSMIDTILDCYSQGFYLWRDEMEMRGMLPEIRFDTERSMALFQNAMKLAKSKEQKQDMLIQSVIAAPYIYMQYQPLYEEFPDTDGLDEFVEYFGVKPPYDLKIFIATQLVLKKIDKMPEKTPDELIMKLNEYIEFGTFRNTDISSRIADYPQKLSLACRGKIENIDKAVHYLREKVVGYEYQEIVDSIIARLNREKADIIKALERKQLEKLPESTAEQIGKKIKSQIDFETKNNADQTEQIDALLTKLVGKIESEETLLSIENELKKISKEVHPRVKYIKDAISFKKKLYQYEAQAESYDKFIYLPEIFKVIEEARKGNPYFQLWMKNMLASSKLINTVKKGLSDSDEAERKTCEELSETIPECIAFLFDKPEKYSFDLFMRIKVNYVWLDDDEYIEIIEQFKNDESCPAGMYEYGIRLYLKDESNSEALNVIKRAADLGYYDAYSFMRKYYTKHDIDSCLKEYYDILVQKSYLYKISSDEKIYYSIDTHRQIEKLMKGTASLAISTSVLSQYILGLFPKYKHEEGKNSFFGLPYGDSAHQKNLKNLLKKVPSGLDGEVLLSYESITDKKISKYIIITTKGIYWNSGDGIQSSMYIKEFLQGKWSSRMGFTLGFCYFAQKVYYIIYYNTKAYRTDLSLDDLEKMAYCGHPLAICNLLVNKEYQISETRQEKWHALKKEWTSKGKFYGVCPGCLSECSKEDIYCPECGTKIN